MTRRIRGRVLFVYLLLSFVLGAALAALIWPQWIELGTERLPLADAAWGAFHLVLLHLFLLHSLRRSGGSLRALLGPMPGAPAFRWAALAAVALVACSFASTVALYLPLSYVAPGFVEDFLLDESMSLVWSARRAVIFTSLIFGLLHLDPLGTALFHAGNNLLAYGLELADALLGGSPMTLEEFRASGWIGGIGLAIGAPLLVWVLRHLADLERAPAAAVEPAAVS